MFLDANLLFTSAHNSTLASIPCAPTGLSGFFQLDTSPYAMEEARRNLERKSSVCLPVFSEHCSAIRLVSDNPSVLCQPDLA
jgi:hypothetical protein